MKNHLPKPPTSVNGNVIRKAYKVIGKYSLDTGNRLEEIGPEAVTHLVAFWEFVSPLFRTVYVEAIEQELRRDLVFCGLTQDEQKEVIEKKWIDYVNKHQILSSPHAWALDKTEQE